MSYQNKITFVISLSLILFLITSCLRTTKPQDFEIDPTIKQDRDPSLETSNNNSTEIDKWLVPLISEYLSDDDSPIIRPILPPPPYTPLISAALNERFTTSLQAYGNQVLNITATEGYIAKKIQSTETVLTFDLQLDDNFTLTDNSDEVEVVIRLNDGNVVGSQRYKITAIYATPEVVVSLDTLTLTQFNNAITNTGYTVKRYNPLNNTALVDIGNQPSQVALDNLYNIISAATPPQNILETQSLLTEIRVPSGPNYAYKPDRSGRWLDPTCYIQDDLTTYAQNNGWGTINNLATSINATAAHAEGFYGDDIVVVLLDSGIDAEDDFDCPDTPQKEMHGTHIKNIIQAVAPNVTIVSKKIFNATGAATLDNLINTFDLLLAVKEIEETYLLQGKKVILNMSFSAPVHSVQGHDMQVWSMLQGLYDLYGDQLLVVTSSGNHGLDNDYKDEVFYPSGYARSFTTLVANGEFTFPPIPNIISVASAGLQSNQIKAVGYNPNHTAIDYLAYGMNLCANNLNGSTCTGDYLLGSSFSTPVVTALAALNWNRCNQKASGEIKSILAEQSFSIIGTTIPLAQYDQNVDCESNTPCIEPLVIPDVNLEQHIKNELNFSGILTCAKMLELTTFNFYGASVSEDEQIRDPTGLEYATNLTTLALNNSYVEDYQFLAKLTNLKILSLHPDSPLRTKSINLNFLTQLEELIIFDLSWNANDFSYLSNCENLRSLEIYSHNFTSADLNHLSNLVGLVDLDLFGANITDINPLSPLINIESLNISGISSRVSDITILAGLTKLRRLQLTNNEITNISALSGLSDLTELGLGLNNITDISSLTNLTKLRDLSLNYNNIEDISALTNLTNMWQLLLHNNNIDDISSLSGMINISSMQLHNNNIDDISSLVLNTGLGEGDNVRLANNNLDLTSGSDDLQNIQILLDRGVNVEYP